MSFSAYVVCDCYQKGKIPPPPHKEFFKFDENGIYLDIPEEHCENASEMYEEFDNWKMNACEHEDMELISESLCTNLGMFLFREFVQVVGGEKKYPILTKYLPEANGGILPAEFAKQALDELLRLEQEPYEEEETQLRENESNDLLAFTRSDRNFPFIYTAYMEYVFLIDKEGFHILHNVQEGDETIPYIAFQSKKFIQHPLSEDQFLYVDMETGDSFESSTSIYPIGETPTKDYVIKVVSEILKPAERYSFLIESLKKLLEASMQTGNPIHWI